MQDRRFSWVFLALIIALTPLIAGCGLFDDDGDDEAEETDTATEEVEEDGETPEEEDDIQRRTPSAEDATPEGTPEADATPGDVAPAPEDATPEEEEVQTEEVGGEIFNTTCAACHQPEGQGVDGIFPALAGNPFVTADDPTAVIEVVLTGRGGMPRFADAYSNEEIAAIVSYIRTDWENDASEISPQDVEDVRQTLGPDPEEEAEEAGGGQQSGEESDEPEATPTETN